MGHGAPMNPVDATGKADALVDVVDLMKRHDLTIEEVMAALGPAPQADQARSSGILSRLFAYIGGIFVFAGLAISIGMRWDDLGSAGRVMVTLGPGFCLFVLALVCLSDLRFSRAATPLFLVAALVQPTGIMVALEEYGNGGDLRHGLLFMAAVMLVQQGAGFLAKRVTVLAFTTIAFAVAFLAVAFDLLDASANLSSLVLGTSLLCVAWSLDRSVHRSLAGLTYFCGSVALLAAAYDVLRRTPAEVLFLGLACGVIVLATVARSRSLLAVGTVALVAYIGDFMYEHFADNLNAPLLLMLLGFVLIGCGAAAVKINSTYIARQP